MKFLMKVLCLFFLCIILQSDALFSQNDPCSATALGIGSTLAGQTLINTEDIADQTDCTLAPDPKNCINGSAYGGWNQTQICEDVWFAVTVPASGSVIAEFSSAGDVTAAIYEGACTGPLTQVTCDGDGGAAADPLVGAYGLTPGSTVYVRVWDFGCNTTQTFDISASAGTNVAGQDIATAGMLIVGGALLTNQTITDSNVLGDETYGVAAPSCNSGPFYSTTGYCEDAWYQVTVPGAVGSGTVSLTIDATLTGGSDHIMAIYKPSPAGSTGFSPLYEVACEDDGANAVVSITVDCAVSGDVLYIRVWNFDCDGNSTFDIGVTQNAAPAIPTTLLMDECSDGNTYFLGSCGSDAAPGLEMFDSGGAASGYGNDENYTVTICIPQGSPAGTCLRAEFIDFELEDGNVNTLSGSNDYMFVYDGTSAGDPLVAGYTGNESGVTGFPGNIYSTNGCLTFNMVTNGDNTGANFDGFEIEFECVNCQNEITPVGGETVTCGTPPTPFTDAGGIGADYGNYEHNVWTYCPSDPSQCIWAEFNSFVTQEDVDYLYIYNGDDAFGDDLIGIFGGNGNLAGAIIKATENSPGGCLTFKFVSSAGITAAGWDATIDCGPCRLSTSSDDCATATQLTENGTYAGWNVGSTGDPACSDPSLNIPCFLSDNTSVSDITELELTTWYEFTIPLDVCLEDFCIALQNVACQDASGTFGLQFAIIEQDPVNPVCLWGDEWPDPILCYDQYVEGVPVKLNQAVIDQGGTGLVPGNTYYIFTDAFNGSSCNWDLVVDNLEPPSINTLASEPANICTGTIIDSLFVDATSDVEFVYDTNPIVDPYVLSGTASSLGSTINFDFDLGTASLLGVSLPANTGCELVTYNVCAIRIPVPTNVTSQCRPFTCLTIDVYPEPPVPTFDVTMCGANIVNADNCPIGSAVIEFEDPNNTGVWNADPTTFILADGDVLNWNSYVAGSPDNDANGRPDCINSGATTALSGCVVGCTDCLNATCEHETMGETDWGTGLTVSDTETFDAGADIDCEDFTATVEDVMTVCTEFIATGNETQVTVAAEGTGCNTANISYEITEDVVNTGNPCGTVTNGGYDPNTGSIDPPLQVGTTYQYCVTVDFSADVACDIDNVCPVILNCDVAPANDDICAAFDLSGGPLTNQNNICADLEVNETGGGASQTVWYEYIVPTGVDAISVATSNNDFNTFVTIYTTTTLDCVANGAATDLSTEITPVPDGSNDDAVAAVNGESYVELCVEEGTTYYIQVDGNAVDEEGYFDITVTDETGNLDCVVGCTDCLNATCEHETMGETDWGTGLTVSDTETFDAGADIDCEDFTATVEDVMTVCTEFIATGNETQVTVAAEGTGCNTANISYEITEDVVNTGNPCGTVTNGGYDPNTGSIDPPLQVGTTYQYCVTVDFSADVACDIDNVCPVILNCDVAPANDDICAAFDLSGGPLTNQNNICADLEVNETGGGASQTVWYEYIVPTGVEGISVATSNNDFNTFVTIYTATTLDCVANGAATDLSTEITPVLDGSNDDAVAAVNGESYVEICVEEGTTYYIQVDGNAVDEEGYFDITVADVTSTGNCTVCDCTDCADFQCPTAVAICGGLVDLVPVNAGGVWTGTAGADVSADQLDPSGLAAGVTYTLTYTYTDVDGCVYDTECSFTTTLDCDAEGGRF